MKTIFERFTAADGVELQGNLYLPERKVPTRGILHVHGLAGNFYENSFLDALVTSAIASEMSLFAFNNRGHDYISDLNHKSETGWKSIKGGAAHEVFTECSLDINAALALMQKHGIQEVILEGHSTGACKAVFSLPSITNSSVVGLSLLSPCDDLGLQVSNLGDRYGVVLENARKLVNSGQADALMPEGTFFDYPISARTYLDYFDANSARDIFPYRSPSLQFSHCRKVKCPVFVCFGDTNECLLDPPEATIKVLESKFVSALSFRGEVIHGASHSYRGYEEVLAEKVISWAKKV